MPIGTDEDGRDDNEGPHCRNCHTGANNCYTCHNDSVAFPNDPLIGFPTAVVRNVSAAYTATTTGPVGNQTNYTAQSFIKQSAVAGTALGDACLDGGFSFPHRTLGKDMLKDELFGIDFDGTPIVAGTVRTANTGALSANSGPGEFEYWVSEDRAVTSIIPAVRTDSGTLEGMAAENLDSVCIDCHGDGTYWNGDDPAFRVTTTTSGLPLGTYGSGTKMGWELLLKGLP
jgi:hypothetical protein